MASCGCFGWLFKGEVISFSNLAINLKPKRLNWFTLEDRRVRTRTRKAEAKVKPVAPKADLATGATEGFAEHAEQFGGLGISKSTTLANLRIEFDNIGVLGAPVKVFARAFAYNHMLQQIFIHQTRLSQCATSVLCSTSGLMKLVLAGNAWRDNGLQVAVSLSGKLSEAKVLEWMMTTAWGKGYTVAMQVPSLLDEPLRFPVGLQDSDVVLQGDGKPRDILGFWNMMGKAWDYVPMIELFKLVGMVWGRRMFEVAIQVASESHEAVTSFLTTPTNCYERSRTNLNAVGKALQHVMLPIFRARHLKEHFPDVWKSLMPEAPGLAYVLSEPLVAPLERGERRPYKHQQKKHFRVFPPDKFAAPTSPLYPIAEGC